MNNMVSQLLPKEQKKLILKWKDVGLLKGCEDEWQEAQLSCVLENQNLLNKFSMSFILKTDSFQQLLKRISIPFVRRVFDPKLFIPFHIVSVQTMASPTGFIYWLDRYGVFRNLEINARSKTMRTKVPLFVHKSEERFEDIKPWFVRSDNYNICLSNTYPELFDVRSQIMLDNETLLTLAVASNMRREIVDEVIFDIRSIIDLHLTHIWKNPEKLLDFIRVASSELGREIGGDANWIIVSPQIAKELNTLSEFKPSDLENVDIDLDVHKFGELQKLRVFVNPKAIANEIILGKRNWDNPLDSGYFYCPYCPVDFKQDVVKKTEDHNPDTIIISRYAKKATNVKYYAVINVIGFAPQQKEQIPQEVALPEGTGRYIVLDKSEEILDEVTLDTTNDID